jgi:hypothetical protein
VILIRGKKEKKKQTSDDDKCSVYSLKPKENSVTFDSKYNPIDNFKSGANSKSTINKTNASMNPLVSNEPSITNQSMKPLVSNELSTNSTNLSMKPLIENASVEGMP